MDEEENDCLVNVNNHKGSCGFIPIHPFIDWLHPLRLVRVDEETGELVRDQNGLCVACRPGK